MKTVKYTKSKNYFEKQFHNEIVNFRDHTDRIKKQFTKSCVYQRGALKKKSNQPIETKHRSLSILWFPTISKVITWFIILMYLYLTNRVALLDFFCTDNKNSANVAAVTTLPEVCPSLNKLTSIAVQEQDDTQNSDMLSRIFSCFGVGELHGVRS